jgi:isopropylmalate/homocitrate/citramalate synthase
MPDLPFLRPLFLLGPPKGIVLGKLSGRNALNTRLKAMGYDVSSTELDDVFK